MYKCVFFVIHSIVRMAAKSPIKVILFRRNCCKFFARNGQIKNLRCISGNFAVSNCKYCIVWYREKNAKCGNCFFNGSYRLNLIQKKYLQRCIFYWWCGAFVGSFKLLSGRGLNRRVLVKQTCSVSGESSECSFFPYFAREFYTTFFFLFVHRLPNLLAFY